MTDRQHSAQLEDWLLRRDRAVQAKRDLASANGHMSLNVTDTDPYELPEPLRSEAVAVLLLAQNAPSGDA